MTIKDVLTAIIGNSDKNENKQPTLVEGIYNAMQLLVQKCDTLNDSWHTEKQILQELEEEVKSISTKNEILSAKFEQDILGQITAVSASCDRALFDKENSDFSSQVKSLQTLVKQRKAMEDEA